MNKVKFEERHGVRKYILHDITPIPVNIVEELDDGWTYKTDTGELLDAPGWNEKGTFFARQLEGKWYKIEEEIGLDDDHSGQKPEWFFDTMGPWDENPFLYDKGMVVTLEGTDDEQQYIFDGWCNLYRRPNGEKGTLAEDCHPHVAMLFT